MSRAAGRKNMSEKPLNTALRIVIFSVYGEGGGLAYRLKLEGAPVTLAMVEDLGDTLTRSEDPRKPEDPEEKKARLSIMDGLIQKTSATKAVEMLKKVPEAERKNWFILADLNYCWKYTQELLGLGFNGLLPTEEDRLFEVDRKMAKEFVDKNYPDLITAETQEFKSVEDAKKFLAETEDIWVLKGDDPAAETFVPTGEDSEIAKLEVIDQLESGKKDYEKAGFILEKKILNGIELTPEMVWLNGEPLYATVDIELKKKYAGNTGEICGCSSCVVFQVPIDCELVRMAIPEQIHAKAKKHPGLFVWDAGIMFSETGEAYYLESCSNRKGWDSFQAELALLPSVSSWFQAVSEGRNPLEGVTGFGASIRGFNNNTDDDGEPSDGLVFYGDPQATNVWLMDAKKDKGKIVSCGYGTDLVVATGAGETIKEALLEASKSLKQITFKKMVYRPYHDLVDKTYQGNMISRYIYGMDNYIFPGDERPVILIDFDLVLADENEELMEGAEAVLLLLAEKGFRLSVFTARPDHEYVREWLDFNLPFVSFEDVTSTKEPSSVYVDDKAIRFNGSWEKTLSDIFQANTFEIKEMDETEIPESVIEKRADTTEEVLNLKEDVKPFQKKRTNKWDDSYNPNTMGGGDRSWADRNPEKQGGDFPS